MNSYFVRMAAGVVLLTATCSNAWSVTISISASKDNTINEDNVNNSAGGAAGISVGTGFPDARRALVAFDVAGNVPAQAIVTDAQLRVYIGGSGTIVGGVPVSLHRLTADWGEGSAASSPSNVGGGFNGAPASAGDATWNERFFGSTSWTNPGADGDYIAIPSVTEGVGRTNDFPHFFNGLAADVQLWLDAPATNFGWILIGREDISSTLRTFYSREAVPNVTGGALSSDWWPTLTVTYFVVPEPAGVLLLVFVVAAGGVRRRR
jgi:hypothetical protein